MNKKLLSVVVGTSALLFSGCIDDAYDLSDIDTTSRVNVNGLVIPVNIDQITLDDIISFDENSKIKAVTIGGERFYALVENGEFNSEDIKIDKVHADQPTIPSSDASLERTSLSHKKRIRRAVSQYAVSYHIHELGDEFTYQSQNLDKSIISLTEAWVKDVRFSLKLSAKNLSETMESTTFTGVTIQLPKEMDCTTSTGTYDAKTGKWYIPELSVKGNAADIYAVATKINLAANNAKVDNVNHTFLLQSDFKVLDGTITLDPRVSGGVPTALPEKLDFHVDYGLNPLEIEAVSGKIKYEYEGMNIDPVSLGDIPDFLSCEGTNLLLANPQIYLSLNNPLADYKVHCDAGLTLTSLRPNAPESLRRLSYSLDDGPVKVGYAGGSTGRQQFVLSPNDKNLNVPDGFSASDLKWYEFSGLCDVLAVPTNAENYSELPETIEIELTNPGVPAQEVKHFVLGTTLPGVKGEYELVAPLALKEGSIIIYSDREDGWGSEDLDALTIEELTVTATADNSTPLSAEMVAYPVNTDGDRIPGVKVTTNVLEAMSEGKPLEIKMEGKIEKLDGIIFEARVRPGTDQSLRPDQTIRLHNIRAKVSGYYSKKF